MSNILILGATSAIAEQTARIYASKGHNLYLVARNEQKLSIIADDLAVRGAKHVHYEAMDLSDHTLHDALCNKVTASFEQVDIVLIAYGTLGDQKKGEQDFSEVLAEINTNLVSTLSLLTLLGNYFEHQGSGTIAVISSVAGDRGRQSNYIYGTAKAGLSIFLQGLRNRLAKHNVQVLTIKPGFVDTPMTRDFPKGLLWVKPGTIAKGIVKAINQKKDIVYLPFFWRYIMLVIKYIPEKIFKKLSL